MHITGHKRPADHGLVDALPEVLVHRVCCLLDAAALCAAAAVERGGLGRHARAYGAPSDRGRRTFVSLPCRPCVPFDAIDNFSKGDPMGMRIEDGVVEATPRWMKWNRVLDMNVPLAPQCLFEVEILRMKARGRAGTSGLTGRGPVEATPRARAGSSEDRSRRRRGRELDRPRTGGSDAAGASWIGAIGTQALTLDVGLAAFVDGQTVEWYPLRRPKACWETGRGAAAERDADTSEGTSRGAAAERDADISRGRVAAPPRRGRSVETSVAPQVRRWQRPRGPQGAERGLGPRGVRVLSPRGSSKDRSRRRRGYDVDFPRR